jgi:WD repeat-containing protein 35
MTVKSVLMDEVMQDPENPSIQDHLLDLDIKSLRDTRSLLKSVGLKDTCQFIEDNPHPRLWKLLAEASLEQLELELAEKAFVRCKDFAGIQFVKKLHHLDSEIKQRAQVATYFEKFDEAERLYLELDCQNLAVDLRVKLGDWFKVVDLLKKGGGAAGDDALLTNTWNTIGDHYYDRQQWARAADYYTQGHNSGRLAECYYSLEEYDRLEQLADSLPENNPLLTKLATMFVMVGMCDQAVKAFTKVNMIDEAIDCCVQLNQWDRAIELSRRHSSRDINSLLVKCAVNLLDKEKILGAIELLRVCLNALRLKLCLGL